MFCVLCFTFLLSRVRRVVEAYYYSSLSGLKSVCQCLCLCVTGYILFISFSLIEILVVIFDDLCVISTMTIDALKTLSSELIRKKIPPKMRSSSLSTVRRSLFGEVNHEESMDFLKKELNEISRSQMTKWNFDFVNERPLNDVNGMYQWTEISTDEVPKLYTSNRLPNSGAKSRKIENNDETQDNVGGSSKNIEIQSRLRDEVTVPKRKLTQTLINNFVKSKKHISNGVVSKSKKARSTTRQIKKTESAVQPISQR